MPTGEELETGAEAALRAGQLAQAETLVEQALRLPAADRSGPTRLRLLQAELLLERRLPQRAIASLAALPALDGALAARREKILGRANFNLGQLQQAEQHVAAGASLARAAGAQSLVAQLLVLEGAVDGDRGRNVEAEIANRKAIALATTLGDRYLRALALNNIGWDRFTAERWAEALALIESARQDAREGGAPLEAAKLAVNAGICLYRLGDFDRARALFQEASATFERMGLPERLVDSVGEIGNTYVLAGDSEEAVKHHLHALELARQHAPDAVLLWLMNLVGSLIDLERWDEAARLNDEAAGLLTEQDRLRGHLALNRAKIAAGRGDLTAAESAFRALLVDHNQASVLVHWEAAGDLAQVYARLGRSVEAERYFRSALTQVEEARQSRAGFEFGNTTFLEGLIRIHQAFVDWLVASGRSDEALEVVESGRTQILSERLEGRRAPPARSLTRMRRRGEVLVSYWVAPRRSFAWVAAPSGITLFTLPGESRLRALVEAYRASLETSLRDPLALERSPGRVLYDILVAPWAGGLASGTRVCVSPDGPLHAVPFAALIAPGPRPHYWIEDAVITVAPSLASLPETAEPLRAGGAVLALGDAPASGPDFPRLPYARAELDALAHHFGAARVTVAGGSQARPEAYLAVDPGRFSIIHFAAHAVANPSSPLDSTIVLAPGARGERLSAREVVRLPLSADLVTLSACRGAGARAYAGVGLVGLTWGFMMAGARQVVAGLWDVADRSTAALMDRLYAGLADGQDPAQALRAAQLAGLRAHETPFHWAAFNLYRGPGRQTPGPL